VLDSRATREGVRVGNLDVAGAGSVAGCGNGPGDVSDYDYMTKYYTLTPVSAGLDVPARMFPLGQKKFGSV
jgi:hypothetical protein